MPRSIVKENDGRLLPTGTLDIEPVHQAPEEERHHIGVRVGLRQGEVNSAIGVQCQDQRDPWVDLLVSECARRL